tara:strand:+ start:172 stop:555 length:384 start_codon:yes stop_codon:yes gene_type:complete
MSDNNFQCAEQMAADLIKQEIAMLHNVVNDYKKENNLLTEQVLERDTHIDILDKEIEEHKKSISIALIDKNSLRKIIEYLTHKIKYLEDRIQYPDSSDSEDEIDRKFKNKKEEEDYLDCLPDVWDQM